MTSTPPADLVYNPFEPGFAADPYPQYARMRSEHPVHESPFGPWLLFGYDDVLRVLRNPGMSVEDRNASPGPMDEAIRDILGDRVDRGNNAMLNRDAPDHTRLRRLVSKVFTPRAVERLRPRIEELVNNSLDTAETRGELDIIADLAFPLPFTVISEMLGTPDVDRDRLREWSGLLVRTLEPLPDLELLPRIAEAGDNLRDLISNMIDAKRAAPADDLLSALIAAEDEGDVLSDEELLDQVMLLYIAGHETTVNLIGNGTLALLRDRAQLDRLAGDPDLARPAVDELEVGGRTIEPGNFVVLVLASANRDPAHWGNDADRVDLRRPDAADHVSFGGGAHHCLGAALARLEGEVALGSLIRRFPRLELAGEPEWNGRLNLRGLERLPVTTG
jgi:cytochrome P450